jgi:vancomycin resistance protein YoaR
MAILRSSFVSLVSKVSRNIYIRRVCLLATAVIIALIILILIDYAVTWGRIHPRISVSGLDIGGLNKQQASRKLKDSLRPKLSKVVKVVYQKKKWSLKPEEYGVSLNVEETVRRSFNYGRDADLLTNIRRRLALWQRKKDISPVMNFNDEKIAAFLEKLSRELDAKAIDAGFVIQGVQVMLVPSRVGWQVDQLEAEKLIKRAFTQASLRTVKLPVRKLKPDLEEKDVKTVIKEVRLIVSQPVRLRYKWYKWRLTRQDLGQLVVGEKKKVAKKWRLIVTLDKGKLAQKLEELAPQMFVEPRNAEFKVSGNKVIIIPSRFGKRVNLEKAYADILTAAKSRSQRVATLKTEPVEPKLTTERAKAMGIREKISSFTTYFNPAQEARVNNIKKLTDSLDGTIVAPGEIFSFNETIGPRTTKKGYKEAPVIVNGELIPAVGGGICQVATTLFNTIFFAGLEVVERHNHSLYISHYPTGRDATVSYGGADLKFRNDTPAYILIKGWYTRNSVTITFYSTKFDVKVTYQTTLFRNFKPYKVKYVKDSNLPKGKQIVEEKGVAGREVSVFRTVRREGKIIHQDKFVSRYLPKDAIVRIGTKETTLTVGEEVIPSVNN